MNRFAHVLRRIDARLDLPQPARGRIMLEIAADVEDLFAVYRERGLGEEEALGRVEEKFTVSEEAIAELVAIHQPAYRRFTDSLSAQARTRFERVLLALLLLSMLGVGGPLLARAEMIRQASDFIWPVVGIGAATGLLVLMKLYQLFVKKDHRTRRLRSGLSLLLLGAGGSLLVAGFGFAVGLHQALQKIVLDTEGLWLYVVRWLLTSAPVMLLGLLTAMAAALFWLMLTHTVERIEQMEVESLLS